MIHLLLAEAVNPLPPRHEIFVTSATYTGDLGGITGADAKCVALAGAGWKALISDSKVDARSRITVKGPVYDRAGRLVVQDPAKFWSGSVSNRVDRDEKGQPVAWWGTWIVFTGTNTDGRRSSGHCANWTSTSGGAQAGQTDAVDYRWSSLYDTTQPSHACSSPSRLYCFK